ncbi:MAG: polysaccharide pyruvyl transferase family protein [Bryobacterales bacterium]|nr:polysaccharide pyruvyl transferase family protein [Bryobacterales bacterium]
MLTYIRSVRPQARLSAVCTYPERVTADYGIPAVPIRLESPYPRTAGFVIRALHRVFVRFPREIATWARTIAHMRKIDLLVIPGTGILDDYAIAPGDLPYGLFRWCVSARLAGAKVLFVSIGAGPINHPVSRWLMKTAASVASYRSFRDQISKDFMATLGLDTRHDPVYPDLTFSLPVPETGRTLAARDQPSVIGVGLMTYYGWRNDSGRGAEVFATYVRKMSDFVAWLLHRGYAVRLLVGEEGDTIAAGRVAAEVRGAVGVDEASRLVCAEIDSVETLLEEIAATDVLIGTRFHNVVYGLLLDKPVISIGYAARNAALLQDAGLGNYSQQIEALDVAVLKEQFNDVRDNWRRLEDCVREKRIRYQQRLQEQFDVGVKHFFASDPSSR